MCIVTLNVYHVYDVRMVKSFQGAFDVSLAEFVCLFLNYNMQSS